MCMNGKGVGCQMRQGWDNILIKTEQASVLP